VRIKVSIHSINLSFNLFLLPAHHLFPRGLYHPVALRNVWLSAPHFVEVVVASIALGQLLARLLFINDHKSFKVLGVLTWRSHVTHGIQVFKTNRSLKLLLTLKATGSILVVELLEVELLLLVLQER